jgi:uncharacterized OsmC-like protein
MDTLPKELKVRVRGQSENATRMNLSVGKFNMVIDEPLNFGGTDAGPSPIQVLLMSLAGCINVTGHLVARQKGLQLNGMKMTIEGVMNPSAFYGASFEVRAGFKQITVAVDADINGAGKKEIEDWLKETENRCPVTDNIKTVTNVSVFIKDS